MHSALNSFITAKIANGRAPRTLSDYHRCLDPFADWCVDRDITVTTLSRGDVRQYVAYLRSQDLSPATVAIHVRNIRCFLRWLWTEGEIETNLATAIEAPKIYRRDELPLTRDEIQRLLSACTGDDLADRDRALILFLLDTGMRIGEMPLMRRDDIHTNGDGTGWARIYGGKTRQYRFVILSAPTMNALNVYLAGRTDDDPALWWGTQGALTDRGMYHAIKRRARAAGLKDRVHPHLFRKTFATAWLDNGGDPERMRVLLGWSSDTLAQMMEIYVASQRSHLERAHRKASPVENWAL